MSISVLYVCLGNICRSPAAEGMLKKLAANVEDPIEIHVESCGLGDWHVGQLPDERMRRAAENRGLTLTTKAQMFQAEDLDRFDYILAADNEVLKELYRHAKTAEQKSKIHLFTNFSDVYKGQDVPDPYYEPNAAFDLVLVMLENSCMGLLNHIYKTRN